jgi:hypothetical protein
MRADLVKVGWKAQLRKFFGHSIWKTKASANSTGFDLLISSLEQCTSEIAEKRRALLSGCSQPIQKAYKRRTLLKTNYLSSLATS